MNDPRYPSVVTAATELAHELNVIVSKADISVRPLKSDAPARKIQAAILRAHEGAAARAVLDALREVGRLRSLRVAL